MNKICKPDVEKILGQLKKFQRDTVEYAFNRLYLEENKTDRFLIADEVGLGKTFIARGVLAKAILHLWKETKRIDIIYICSNSQIARQNINRLNIFDNREFELSSRITLLPIQVSDLQDNKVNFVSFTPGTSLEQNAGAGIYKERALLYWLLKEAWDFRGKGAINLLQANVQYSDRFRNYVKTFKKDNTIDKDMTVAFANCLNNINHKHLRNAFSELCDKFGRVRKFPPRNQIIQRNIFIGTLRSLLAKTCLQKLEPDFIILDEFQRFKHLLNDKGEDSELARELFNYTENLKHENDEKKKVKILLLSATPYKMYTLDEEIKDENHYEDFLQTYYFLTDHNEKKRTELQSLIDDFRREIFRNNKSNALIKLKNNIESKLRKVITRTEKLSASIDRNGMLKEIKDIKYNVKSQDIKDYLSLNNLANITGDHDVMEYWKSSPYLLNFMDNYQFKDNFIKTFKSENKKIKNIYKGNKGLTIKQYRINNYNELNSSNTRLRNLLELTIQKESWKLLWIPASFPYYKSKGVFENPEKNDITKKLIFSAWKVVPKAVSTLVSYEAERLMNTEYNESIKNNPENRKLRRLNFAVSEGQKKGMPVLGMIYPSHVLADICDPLKLHLSRNKKDLLLDFSDVINELSAVIKKLVNQLKIKEIEFGSEDESWYWITPLLLDIVAGKLTKKWFDQNNLTEIWKGEDDDNGRKENIGWRSHISKAKEQIELFLKKRLKLGKKPSDLYEFLAYLSLGGFGICSLRALTRITGKVNDSNLIKLKNESGKIASSFLSLFNSPDVIRMIDKNEPYWRRVIEYCSTYNLQAVLDEYIHVLYESEGLVEKDIGAITEGISKVMEEALSIRTATLSVDNIIKIKGKGFKKLDNFGRIKFAMRLQKEKNEVDKEVTREDQVRTAFNSPFWPFILATTSIGQEGLDFHTYCHSIIHWNLPSNPVDLEQREGRIHRYKGHAVRKNVAKNFPEVSLGENENDIWENLFKLAKKECGDSNEIAPYWIFPIENGAVIERHVPAIPLSKEQLKLSALKKSLAVYRMVFGQPRQDELAEYLIKHYGDDLKKISELLRIDLSPVDHN